MPPLTCPAENAVSAASPSERTAFKRNAFVAAALIGIIGFAAHLCFYRLDAKSFWSDEGYSVMLATLSPSLTWKVLWAREGNMSFYYLLLRGWMHFGQSEFFVRSLSVVFALATVPLVFLLGRRLFSVKAGLVAALLFAIHADTVRFAQEARGYTLLVFLLTLSSLLLLDLLERNSPWSWAAYVLASALAFYTQFFGILVTFGHFLCVVFSPAPPRLKRRYYAALAAIGLLTSGGWAFMLSVGARDFGWIPPTTAAMVWDAVLQVSGNHGPWLLALYVALCGRALWDGLRHPPPATATISSRWRYGLLCTWLLLPPTLVLAFSLVRNPMFVPRYFVMCVPPLVLLAGAALAQVQPKWIFVAVLFLVVYQADLGVERYYVQDFDVLREDSREMTRFVLKHARPGDGILTYFKAQRFLFEYYARLNAKLGPKPAFVFPGPEIGMDDFMFQRQPPLHLPEQSVAPDRCHLWLVLQRATLDPPHKATSDALIRSIERQYPRIERTRFLRYVVLRMSASRPECAD